MNNQNFKKLLSTFFAVVFLSGMVTSCAFDGGDGKRFKEQSSTLTSESINDINWEQLTEFSKVVREPGEIMAGQANVTRCFWYPSQNPSQDMIDLVVNSSKTLGWTPKQDTVSVGRSIVSKKPDGKGSELSLIVAHDELGCVIPDDGRKGEVLRISVTYI